MSATPVTKIKLAPYNGLQLNLLVEIRDTWVQTNVNFIDHFTGDIVLHVDFRFLSNGIGFNYRRNMLWGQEDFIDFDWQVGNLDRGGSVEKELSVTLLSNELVLRIDGTSF